MVSAENRRHSQSQTPEPVALVCCVFRHVPCGGVIPPLLSARSALFFLGIE